MIVRPRRSALYMPGSNGRALEKAKTLPADVLIFDLEDAVAPEAKEVARAQVCGAVAGADYGTREIIVRINGLTSAWGADDLAAAAAAGPDALLIPKVSSPADLVTAARQLQNAGASERVRLWASGRFAAPVAAIRDARGRLPVLIRAVEVSRHRGCLASEFGRRRL